MGYNITPPIGDSNLVDSLIQWEGFIPHPKDIGDGKVTLGSGLTDPRWHALYKQRGNKWSQEDNRRAVTEEVTKRRKWAEQNIPNWSLLPAESQKALLSYKYNYDFSAKNSPLMFKALSEKNWEEVARQMDATSTNPLFKKGLEDRRRREQEWFLSGLINSGHVKRKAEGGSLKSSWDDLSLAEKAEMMKVAIKNGITDLATIRQKYNEFAEGGSIEEKPDTLSEEQYRRIMRQVAKENWRTWGDRSEDAAYLRILKDPSYDYRGYYNKYPNSKADANTHWTDEFKTVYHPTFSDESRYSGVVHPQFNPSGQIGGHWIGEGKYAMFMPSPWTPRKYPDGGLFHRLIRFTSRKRHNTSPTKEKSEKYENLMARAIIKHQQINGGSDPGFDIAFQPDKKILIGSTTTSTNALDSLVKYAAIHNANPQLSQHPIFPKSEYSTPREINNNEMLGLAFQETSNGAWPHVNSKKSRYPRALANSNFFTAYGNIPADDFVNDYHYNVAGVSRDIPPLLDAFQYFAQGDYNRNDPNHTRDVNNAGKRAWQNPNVLAWWNTSDLNAGKNLYDYWYNKTKEELKRKK